MFVVASLYMQLHVMVNFEQNTQNRFTKVNGHEIIPFA